jgi:hypothetical protein
MAPARGGHKPLTAAERRARVLAGAERVLHGNWREGRRRDGVHYGFTCPATPRYRHQWYWDSCFHAIAWLRLDPARAREELRTLLRAGRLDGFIPHTAFWDRPAGWRRAPFYGTHSIWGSSATATIGTPLLALAWERVAAMSADDPEFATEAIGQLRLHYDWLEHERDVDGDGLLTIIHPDESGLDDSPKYDRLYGWMRHDRPGFFWLVERCRRLGYEARRIVERYDEHVEDVLVNVFYALALRALGRLDEEHGDRYTARAERTEQALLERCYDERTGLFFDLAGRDERCQSRSAAGWWRSTCSTAGATWRRAGSRPSPRTSRRSTRAFRHGAAGAGRRGSTRPGCWCRRCASSATPSRPTRSSPRSKMR